MQDSEGSTTAQWARDAEINLATDDKFEDDCNEACHEKYRRQAGREGERWPDS